MRCHGYSGWVGRVLRVLVADYIIEELAPSQYLLMAFSKEFTKRLKSKWWNHFEYLRHLLGSINLFDLLEPY